MDDKVVFNGVSYDKHNLPDDIRLAIERHKAVDWRHVRLRQGFTTWAGLSTMQRVASVIFLMTLAVTLFLAFYSYFSNVSSTISVWGAVAVVYVGLLIALLGAGSLLLPRTSRLWLPLRKKPIRSLLALLTASAGTSLVLAFAAFSGLPAVLHHLTSEAGSIELTVDRKTEAYSHYRCSPALFMKEFTWPLSKPVCPGMDVYKKLEQGDVVTVHGEVSSFGVQAKAILIKSKSIKRSSE